MAVLGRPASPTYSQFSGKMRGKLAAAKINCPVSGNYPLKRTYKPQQTGAQAPSRLPRPSRHRPSAQFSPRAVRAAASVEA